MLRTGAKGRYAVILRDLQMPVPVELGQSWPGSSGSGGGRSCYARSAPGRRVRAGCGSAPRMPTISTTRPDHPFHATHIALHGIAHMLLGHQHTAVWEQLISLLAPDVDQALIRLILGRSAYSTTEEREAETLASLILSSAARS
jgi:hypothetical protein